MNSPVLLRVSGANESIAHVTKIIKNNLDTGLRNMELILIRLHQFLLSFLVDLCLASVLLEVPVVSQFASLPSQFPIISWFASLPPVFADY